MKSLLKGCLKMPDAKIKLFSTNELIFKINVESGQKGEIGITPNITIDAVSGPPNVEPTVVKTGTPTNPNFTFTIPQGKPFIIEVEYPTINDLENNTNSNPSEYEPELFDLAIITSNQGVEDPDNAKLYIFDNGPIGG